MSLDLTKIATIELLREIQRRMNCQEKPEKRIVIFGPPGAGKAILTTLRRAVCDF